MKWKVAVNREISAEYVGSMNQATDYDVSDLKKIQHARNSVHSPVAQKRANGGG